MSNNRTQECININKENVDLIAYAMEELWSLSFHGPYSLNQINDVRARVGKIKEKMEKINEIKICWE